MKLYSILFEAISKFQQAQQELSGKQTTIDKLQKHFAHFHLSRRYLGTTFTFTPRVPPEPYSDNDGNIIEDDFTKRISLAADIDDARDAIADYPETYYYIYATNEKNIYPIRKNIPKCPKNPPKKYGGKFNLTKWLEKNHPEELSRIEKERGFTYNLAPSKLEPEIKQQFQGCVPDSNKTHEEWSLKPLTMTFVGTIGQGADTIDLTKDGEKIINSNSKT